MSVLVVAQSSSEIPEGLVNNPVFVTVHSKCSQIPPSTSTPFATRVRKSRAVRFSWSPRLFMLAAECKMRASNSPAVSTFVLWTSLFVQPHWQKSNGVWSGDSNSCISPTTRNYTHVRTILFSCHINRFYHLPKCSSFLLNQPVCMYMTYVTSLVNHPVCMCVYDLRYFPRESHLCMYVYIWPTLLSSWINLYVYDLRYFPRESLCMCMTYVTFLVNHSVCILPTLLSSWISLYVYDLRYFPRESPCIYMTYVTFLVNHPVCIWPTLNSRNYILSTQLRYLFLILRRLFS
jgi:hypothetical protein